MTKYLVCLDMDRVLVDHLSTWQFVYDKLGISNEESFDLYNQGLLDEWAWIKLDLALIKSSSSEPISDGQLRALMEGMPMMKGWRTLIGHLLHCGVEVAIVSGGLQKTARDIAAHFPSDQPWRRRWGGIDRHTALNWLKALIQNCTSLPTDGSWMHRSKTVNTVSATLAAIRFR